MQLMAPSRLTRTVSRPAPRAGVAVVRPDDRSGNWERLQTVPAAPRFSGLLGWLGSGRQQRQREFLTVQQPGIPLSSAFRGMDILKSLRGYQSALSRNWNEPFGHIIFYRYFSDDTLRGPEFPNILNRFAESFVQAGILKVVESKLYAGGQRFQELQLTPAGIKLFGQLILEEPVNGNEVEHLKQLFAPNAFGQNGLDVLNRLAKAGEKSSKGLSKPGLTLEQLFPGIRSNYDLYQNVEWKQFHPLRELGLIDCRYERDTGDRTTTYWFIDERGKRLLASKNLRAEFKLSAEDYGRVLKMQLEQVEAMIPAKEQALAELQKKLDAAKAQLETDRAGLENARQLAIKAYDEAEQSQEPKLQQEKEAISVEKLQQYNQLKQKLKDDEASLQEQAVQFHIAEWTTRETVRYIREQGSYLKSSLKQHPDTSGEDALKVWDEIRRFEPKGKMNIISPEELALEIQAESILRRQMMKSEIDALRN